MADLKSPWTAERAPTDLGSMIVNSEGEEIGYSYRVEIAPLFAAAPELLDALKSMIGFATLLEKRPDLPAELRDVISTNHRVVAARELLAKMGIHQL